MPLLNSPYKAPAYLPGGDLQSAIPVLLRRVRGVSYTRERISTPDDDFIDLDWMMHENADIVLIIHGLEASSQNTYVKGMVKSLYDAGCSVAAMNLRGCNGELNRQVRAYNGGSTEDIETVIEHIILKFPGKNISLVGFSLGGNLILKYIGERGEHLQREIKKAIAISVPFDLQDCAEKLDLARGYLYRRRFLNSLKPKLFHRIGKVSFSLTKEQVRSIQTMYDFDAAWTVPFYGFKDPVDYWQSCSSKNFIKGIRIPTLILNARNDPFFSEASIPEKICANHPFVFLETPDTGGHVGFCITHPFGKYYSEMRTIEFLSAP